MKNKSDQPTAAGPPEGSRRTPGSDAACPHEWEAGQRGIIVGVSRCKLCGVLSDIEHFSDCFVPTREQMAGRIRQLEEVLAKYCHCRHACVDCFCTKEARATLWRDPAPDASPRESGAKPPERKGQ